MEPTTNPPEPVIPAAPSQKLSSPLKLFTQAWLIYQKKLLTFIFLAFIGMAAFLAVLLLPIVGVFLATKLPAPLSIIVQGVCVLIAFLGAFYVFCRFQFAFTIVATRETCGVKEAISATKTGTGSFLWLSGLAGFVLFGGYLLFIVPGILFTVWFFAWPFVFVVDSAKGMNSLLRSKALVAGHGWAVAGRLFAAWVISTLLSVVPLVGPILAILLVPFNLIYAFLIYQELKLMKTVDIPPASTKSKAVILVLSVLGYLIVPLLLIFFAFTFLVAFLSQAQFKLPGFLQMIQKPSPAAPPEVTLPDPVPPAIPTPITSPTPDQPEPVLVKPSNSSTVASLFETMDVPLSATIILKSGQAMSGRIVEKDSKGIWFEVGQNAKVYLTPKDIKEIERE